MSRARGLFVAWLVAGAAACGGSDGALDAGTDASLRADAGATDAAADAGIAAGRIDALLALFGRADVTEAELDAAIHDVAWDARWPLLEADRALFVTRWDGAGGDVSLVGDVVGWEGGAVSAMRAATGVHYFAVVDRTRFLVAAEGAKYKWHATPDVFLAPPEATAYGFDENGEHGFVAPPEAAAWRERFPALASAHLDELRTVRTFLPAGFTVGTPAARDARVLLAHDGQNVMDPGAPWGGWRLDEGLVAAGLADAVVIAVDNAPDRFDAYAHVADTLDASGPRGGRADDYLALLETEALPFARARYGIGADRDHTVVMGSSLGGLVSLYLALARPDLARCVIAMSPTLGWGAFDPSSDGSSALVRRWPTEVGHGSVAIYLDSGGAVTGACVDPDGDGVFEDSDDSDNHCVTTQLRDALAALGYRFDEDLFHWHEPGAQHDEAAWAARVPRALEACVTAGW